VQGGYGNEDWLKESRRCRLGGPRMDLKTARFCVTEEVHMASAPNARQTKDNETDEFKLVPSMRYC